ncbi:MAG: 50S ribosomal protein L6 [Nitrospinae bacterium]|nr:50S ribosomal protein L6 [Nitrospinota bacterium]
MSRIGLKPINVPDNVEVTLEGKLITVKGPKGVLTRELHERPKVELNENVINVSRTSDSQTDKSLHGLTRSLIFNMVEGVSNGFEKTLEVIGLGYRVELKGKNLVLNIGFSHPVNIDPIDGIDFEVESDREKSTIKVKGIDKEIVGWVASEIRRVKPPEPYKGKGIRYADEYVRRKVGKTAV